MGPAHTVFRRGAGGPLPLPRRRVPVKLPLPLHPSCGPGRGALAPPPCLPCFWHVACVACLPPRCPRPYGWHEACKGEGNPTVLRLHGSWGLRPASVCAGPVHTRHSTTPDGPCQGLPAPRPGPPCPRPFWHEGCKGEGNPAASGVPATATKDAAPRVARRSPHHPRHTPQNGRPRTGQRGAGTNGPRHTRRDGRHAACPCKPRASYTRRATQTLSLTGGGGRVALAPENSGSEDDPHHPHPRRNRGHPEPEQPESWPLLSLSCRSRPSLSCATRNPPPRLGSCLSRPSPPGTDNLLSLALCPSCGRPLARFLPSARHVQTRLSRPALASVPSRSLVHVAVEARTGGRQPTVPPPLPPLARLEALHKT